MAAARGTDRWYLAGLAGVVAVTVLLFVTPLLWLGSMPALVGGVLLLLASAPAFIGPIRSGRGWPRTVFVLVVAGLGLFAAMQTYVPPYAELRDTLAATGIPTMPGAEPIGTNYCRYCPKFPFSDGPSHPAIVVEVVTADVEQTCHAAIAPLAGQGWQLVDTRTDRCAATFHRPARLGLVYVLVVEVRPDQYPTDPHDIAHSPPLSGRVAAVLSL